MLRNVHFPEPKTTVSHICWREGSMEGKEFTLEENLLGDVWEHSTYMQRPEGERKKKKEKSMHWFKPSINPSSV